MLGLIPVQNRAAGGQNRHVRTMEPHRSVEHQRLLDPRIPRHQRNNVGVPVVDSARCVGVGERIGDQHTQFRRYRGSRRRASNRCETRRARGGPRRPPATASPAGIGRCPPRTGRSQAAKRQHCVVSASSISLNATARSYRAMIRHPTPASRRIHNRCQFPAAAFSLSSPASPQLPAFPHSGRYSCATTRVRSPIISTACTSSILTDRRRRASATCCAGSAKAAARHGRHGRRRRFRIRRPRA